MKSRITLRADYTSLLIPLMLLLEGQFDYLLALLLSATVHECGHLLSARLLGIPVASLHISVLGAKIQLKEPLISYKREWLLCAAGPLFSGLFSFGTALLGYCLPALPLPDQITEISLALGIVNLLPVGWLDGGRMLRAAAYQCLPHNAARVLVRAVSLLCFLTLWMTSVYLILRMGHSLSLFVFSFSLFLRFFLSKSE